MLVLMSCSITHLPRCTERCTHKLLLWHRPISTSHMQLLDEFHKEEEPENAMVRLKELMEQDTKAGKLAPELDLSHFPKKPTVRQRQALQGLRNLMVCVWSEAARYGPERCAAPLARAGAGGAGTKQRSASLPHQPVLNLLCVSQHSRL